MLEYNDPVSKLRYIRSVLRKFDIYNEKPGVGSIRYRQSLLNTAADYVGEN
jgi:hypothetical protein